jgi:hypothetical protein
LLFEGKKIKSNFIKKKDLFNRSRHRRQLQGQHLFSGSSINSRRIAPNDHFENPRHGIPINSFNTTTTNNNNNNDILPAVGM